ncbi:hydrogenase formation protein HypD [Aliiruegeria sabulilitoris]|uniref:hydrogenase formation protein HypD n=1 Tax=Aliiruegeria sabulilitoris TaxID=1510458 RepID=UPI00082F99F5|nr:hydrogenase formation protein HypD [Aliiruegeria sabulilitoris]NDR56748.1 hydrogenase formation protein HypD [Pseudoruegeria sp. M32A2M]
MSLGAAELLERIRALDLPEKVRIMNVCGGHERSITQAGLRNALPPAIELIPGPGCPVCVCPEEDVYQAIQLAMNEDLTLATFGDMLRVPVNVRKTEVRSLEQAKAAGADVVPVASPQEVVALARANPDRRVVFFAAGFETTTAPVAAMMAQGVPDNLLLLLSGRLTWPAVSMLLNSGEVGFDALIAPGHVGTVMGPEEWEFVVEEHNVPAAIAGFDSDSLLAAIYSVLRQLQSGKPALDNCYTRVVQPGGNPTARRFLSQVMEVTDATWRGIGTIPASGFSLRDVYAAHDARKLLPDYGDAARRRVGEMPAGCDCAQVVLGRIYPDQCRIFGAACTPRTPVGPCMVSDEGACRIWWSSGKRTRVEQAAE